MALCVAGNVHPERIIRLAEELLPPAPGKSIEREYGSEDFSSVCKSFTEQEMEVSMPMFMLGFKDGPAGSGNLAISRELTAELACELLAGIPLLFTRGFIRRG
jgi:hypothetical protein